MAGSSTISIRYHRLDNDNYVYVGEQSHGSQMEWRDDAYRTITLAEPATGETLTWLQNNAVKQ